jgi:hypothetical protein
MSVAAVFLLSQAFLDRRPSNAVQGRRDLQRRFRERRHVGLEHHVPRGSGHDARHDPAGRPSAALVRSDPARPRPHLVREPPLHAADERGQRRRLRRRRAARAALRQRQRLVHDGDQLGAGQARRPRRHRRRRLRSLPLDGRATDPRLRLVPRLLDAEPAGQLRGRDLHRPPIVEPGGLGRAADVPEQLLLGLPAQRARVGDHFVRGRPVWAETCWTGCSRTAWQCVQPRPSPPAKPGGVAYEGSEYGRSSGLPAHPFHHRRSLRSQHL